MRGVLRSAALAVGFMAAGTMSALAQPLFSPAQDPLVGARLFTDKGCITCHTVHGKGGKVGPDLSRVARPNTFFDLAAKLWNHAPQMAKRMQQLGIKRPQLTAQESGNLVAYLYTLSYFDPPGNVQAGRRLFSDKRCIACHQVGGAGGSVGPRLDTFQSYGSPIALAAAMWNHGPNMKTAMEAKGIERPAFSGSELLDLMAYIRDVSGTPQAPLYVLPGRAAEGLRLFIDKRCSECHSASADGREGTVNLAEREAQKSVTDFAAAMWNKMPKMVDAMKGKGIVFRQLRPEEMADIVAFLYSVRYFAAAGDPRNGVTLATYKGCLGCHGLYGERGKPASDLTTSKAIGTPAGALASLWNHALIADPRTLREGAPWPTFTGQEMADLVAYLRSLRRTP